MIAYKSEPRWFLPNSDFEDCAIDIWTKTYINGQLQFLVIDSDTDHQLKCEYILN